MKYKSWEKWISNNLHGGDVFDYWVKAKEQFKDINVDFSKNENDLKDFVENQYIEKKIIDFENYFLKKHNIDLKIHRDVIEYFIKDVNIKNKEFIKSIESSFRYNNVKKDSEKIFYLTLCLEKSKIFLNFKTHKDIEDYIGNKAKYEIKGNFLIVKIESEKALEYLASPVWCVNFSSKQLNEYFERYKIYLVWIETKDGLKMYGINFLNKVMDLNVEDEKVFFNAFDYFDRIVMNSDVENIVKTIKNEKKIKETNYFIKFLSKYILKDKNLNAMIFFLSLRNFETQKNLIKIVESLNFNDFKSLIKDINYYYGQSLYEKFKEIVLSSKKLREFLIHYVISENMGEVNISVVDMFADSLIDSEHPIDEINFDVFLKKVFRIRKKLPKKKIIGLRRIMEKSPSGFLFIKYFDSEYKKTVISKTKFNVKPKDIIDAINDTKDLSIARFGLKKFPTSEMINTVLNQNIDIKKILSTRDREILWINLEEKNNIYKRVMELYVNDNAINKSKIVKEKIKNKTLKLYFMVINNVKETRRNIKKINDGIDRGYLLYDSMINNFDRKKIGKMYIELLNWFKYSDVFIENIDKYIDNDKKRAMRVLRAITEKNYLKKIDTNARSLIRISANYIMMNNIDSIEIKEIIKNSAEFDEYEYSENPMLPNILYAKNGYKLDKNLFGLKKINIINIKNEFRRFFEENPKIIKYLLIINDGLAIKTTEDMILAKTKEYSFNEKRKIKKMIKEAYEENDKYL